MHNIQQDGDSEEKADSDLDPAMDINELKAVMDYQRDDHACLWEPWWESYVGKMESYVVKTKLLDADPNVLTPWSALAECIPVFHFLLL